MPLPYMLLIIAVVLIAAGLTVVAMQGVGFWVLIPLMILGLGLRAWMARK
ncbi:MAG: hypothetical protein KC448_14070 [Yoonia sp.]|nr:hypothetical protein [Yoonia sp.]